MKKKLLVEITRFNKDLEEATYIDTFNIEAKENQTILETLENIKYKKDASLSYRFACKSGVCGSCAIRVNGKEVLACKCRIQDKDKITALNNSKILKDLIISLDYEKEILSKSKAYLQEYKEENISNKEIELIEIQSKCILCQSCYSSCPVYEVNKDFLGPYALSRVLRYVNDVKENNNSLKLKSIQKNGIWDCTLCGNCSMVCPQFIDSKTDILKLRMKSIQEGFKEPKIETHTSFDLGFDSSSGFNPNF